MALVQASTLPLQCERCALARWPHGPCGASRSSWRLRRRPAAARSSSRAAASCSTPCRACCPRGCRRGPLQRSCRSWRATGRCAASLPAPHLQCVPASWAGRRTRCRRPQQPQVPMQDAGEPGRPEQSAGPWPGSLHIEPAPERLVPEAAVSPPEPEPDVESEPDKEAEQPVSEVRLRRSTPACGQRGACCPAASAECCACGELPSLGTVSAAVSAGVPAQAGGGEPEGGPAVGDDAQSLAGASAGKDPAPAGAAQAPAARGAARARPARAGSSPAPENKHKLEWLMNNHVSRHPGAQLGGPPAYALL